MLRLHWLLLSACIIHGVLGRFLIGECEELVFSGKDDLSINQLIIITFIGRRLLLAGVGKTRSPKADEF